MDSAPSTIVVVAGQLHAQLLPQGAAPSRAPLRIATADASFAIPIAGEIWLSPGYAAVLAGVVEREVKAASDAPPALESIGAGQALRGLTAKPSAGPRTLDQVQSSYAGLRGRAASQAASAAADAERELARALDAWDAAGARATELLSGQREAKQRGDVAAAQAAQRALVELAQTKLSIRRRVRAAFELAAARQLVAADAAELAAFESRVVARAASAMPSGS